MSYTLGDADVQSEIIQHFNENPHQQLEIVECAQQFVIHPLAHMLPLNILQLYG